MSSNDPQQNASDPKGNEGPSRPPVPPITPVVVESTGGSKRLWLWAIGAGLVAAMTAWTSGEAVRRAFPRALEPKIVAFPTAADTARVIVDKTKSAAANFALQGTILGALLGLAGGLSRRSVGRALLATVIGAVLGAAAAAGAAYGMLPIYYKNVTPETDALGLALLTHGAVWSAPGAMAGAAFGIGRGAVLVGFAADSEGSWEESGRPCSTTWSAPWPSHWTRRASQSRQP